MNTFKKVGILFSALFILGACNNAGTGGSGGSQTSSTVESPAANLTAEQIFKNTQDAMEKVKSYQVDTKISSSITVAEQPFVMDINSVSLVTMDPLLVKSTIKAASDENAQDVVQYADSQFFYMPNPATDGWYKIPLDNALTGNNYDAFGSILKKINNLSSKMTSKEEGANYVVSLDLEGADAAEFSKIIDGQAATANLKYTAVNLVFTVDKTTFLPTTTSLNTDFEISDGNTSSDSTSSSAASSSKVVTTQTYSNFDKVEAFTLPEETKDAQPFGQQ